MYRCDSLKDSLALMGGLKVASCIVEAGLDSRLDLRNIHVNGIPM